MSRIKIFPPVIEVYPNDRQLFTAEASPPPMIWSGVGSNGHVDADGTLVIDGLESSVSSGTGLSLFSGIGTIDLTISDNVRPTTTGHFFFTGFINDVNGFQYQYAVDITPTAVTVRDEGAGTLFTESYSTVSGDVYRLELNAGFRLYRNGVLKHSRISLPTVVVYPMNFAVQVNEPVATDPARVAQPLLVGDWRLAPVVIFTTPSHGFLTNLGPGIRTEYFGGTVPGRYTLAGQVAAAADGHNLQRALATIDIPALQILGPTDVTAEPGQKLRFKTNYDAAQTLLIAWSVVSGGGSFTQGEFTAATTPGVSVVRATASVNSQVADITVTVPAVITNANNYVAAKAGEQIDFDTNIIQVPPSLVSIGAAADGTGNITPGLPAGIQQGDILFLPVETANEAVSTPSGYAAVADSPQGTGTGGGAASTRLTALWKRATPSEVAPTITDPGDHALGRIYAFRGCIDSGNPWDVTAGDVAAAATTAVSIPGDTTTVDKCLVVLALAHGTDTGSPQVSGYANADLTSLGEVDDVNSVQGNGGGLGIATGVKATAGAYGATTATLATSSVQGRMSIALKPAITTWSASIGSIDSSTGVWTAPSLPGQTAKINVVNGLTTVTIEVPVLEVFPLDDPILPINWDLDIPTLVGMSEDRSSRVTREKASGFDAYQLKFTSRTLAEAETVALFFRSHGYGKMFILDDALRGIRKVGWFDSPIRFEGADECAIDMAFRFLEARL